MSASVEVFEKYMNPVFIETGMGQGIGIHQALFAGFERVFSIELSPFLYERCSRVFKHNPRVTLFLGDSTAVLPHLLKIINEPVTFWLDAHYSGGATALGDVVSPLLMEIEIIRSHHIKTHTIMIDDLRDWRIETHGFNTESLKNAILEVNPAYTFALEDGATRNDILVAKI